MNVTESEDQAQRLIFDWAHWQQGKYPQLEAMYHAANEGKRSGKTDGYREGHEGGIKAGGFVDGYETGYEVGYKEGSEDERKGIRRLSPGEKIGEQ